MEKFFWLCYILALKCVSLVDAQELYLRDHENDGNRITSQLREETLELSLHEAEFYVKSLQEKELVRNLREKELLKTLQERELKIQTLQKEIAVLDASYRLDDIFIRRVCSVHSAAVFPHPVECQLYYNCSYAFGYFWYMDAQVPYRSVYLSECDFPFVFSTKTLKCENYTTTECDGRILHKWECRYYKTKLPSNYQCERRFPNCEGKSDGLWPDTTKYIEGTSVLIHFFIRCKDERFEHGGTCAYDHVWGGDYTYLYDQKCSSTYEIPVKAGGLLPSCNGVRDGNYKFPATCKGYYRCENGTSSAVKCPISTSYDYKSKECSQSYNDNCQYVGK